MRSGRDLVDGADNWLLYDRTSPSANAARALTQGRIHDESGHLVASVAEEGLLRTLRHLAATPR